MMKGFSHGNKQNHYYPDNEIIDKPELLIAYPVLNRC